MFAIREMERKRMTMMRKTASSKCCLKKPRANQVLRVQVIAESVALSMAFMSAHDRSLLSPYVIAFVSS